MSEPSQEARLTLQAALQALKNGDKAGARRLAQRAAALDPGSEAPWLILARLSSPKASLEYVHKALALNPESRQAKEALAWAEKRAAEEAPAAPTPPAVPAPETSETLVPAAAPAVQAPAEPAPQSGSTQPVRVRPPESPQPPDEQTVSPALEPVPLPIEQAPAPVAAAAPPAPLAGAPAPLAGAPAPLVGAPASRPKPRLQRFALPAAALVVVIVLAVLLLPRLLPSPSKTPDCGQDRLILGSNTFPMKAVQPAADGTLDLSLLKGGSAYRLAGKQDGYIIGLGPDASKLVAAGNPKAGDLATVWLSNCDETTFTLQAPENGQGYTSGLLSAPGAAFVLFGQGEASFVVRGGPVAAQAVVTSTPNPAGTQVVEAEIALGQVKTSADKQRITVSLSVHNTGGAAFTVRASDVLLTPAGGTGQPPQASQPELPFEIAAGATEPFTFTFDRPAAGISALQILGVELDVEGY